MHRSTRHSAEVRERAVRLLQDHVAECPSPWAATLSIAEKIGCSRDTLRHWVRQAERDAGLRAGASMDKRARLKDLERENRELRRANDIFRKASAYFAVA